MLKKIINACVTKESTRKYYVSVLIEEKEVNTNRFRS